MKYVGYFPYDRDFHRSSGVDFCEDGHRKILLEGNFKNIFESLSRVLGAEFSDDNVYGTTVENLGNLLCVYMIKGRNFIVVEAPAFQPGDKRPILRSEMAKQLSSIFSTKALFYNNQPYEERFDIYENDSLLEKFSFFPEEELELQKETNNIDQRFLHYFPKENQYAYFSPLINRERIEEMQSSAGYKNPFSIGSYLLSQKNIYIPGIHWKFFIDSERVPLKIESLKADDFEGLGLLRLKSTELTLDIDR